VERFNRTLVDFDPNVVNAVSEAARAAYARSPNALLPASQFNPRGGVIFATPDNRNIYSTDNAWAPRFGFAWSPAAKDAAKMAIRGGFGAVLLDYRDAGRQPARLQRPHAACSHARQLPHAERDSFKPVPHRA